MKVVGIPSNKKATQNAGNGESTERADRSGNADNADSTDNTDNDQDLDTGFFQVIQGLKKGMTLPVKTLEIKEGETSPPKRYNSGSMILAMENAGQLIEDEELRAQIKGSGIGTSATRAEILNPYQISGAE